MTDLREFEFIELNWYQPDNWKKSYILKFDEEVVATLEHGSIWTNKAVGKTTVGEWSMQISGFFKRTFTLRKNGQSKNLIQMPLNLGKSKISVCLPSGNIYEWKRASLMQREYGWYRNDEILYDFSFVIALIDKKRLKATFMKSNLSDEDLSLLLLIGTYFMINIQQSSAAAA